MINAVGIKARKNASRRHSCLIYKETDTTDHFSAISEQRRLLPGRHTIQSRLPSILHRFRMIFPHSLPPCRNERRNDLRLRVLFVFCDGIGVQDDSEIVIHSCEKTCRSRKVFRSRETRDQLSVSTSQSILSEIESTFIKIIDQDLAQFYTTSL